MSEQIGSIGWLEGVQATLAAVKATHEAVKTNTKAIRALTVASDALVGFTKAPYHATTDWESEYRKVMMISANAIGEVQRILSE